MPVARRGFLTSIAAVPIALGARGAPASAAPSGEENALAEVLAEAVKRQFGAHLDAAELETVKKNLAEGLERADRLRRQARLTNADEPVARFEAWPPQRRGGGR